MARTASPSPRFRQRLWRLFRPALVVALLGLVGVATTLRAAPLAPAISPPIRYTAGPPVANRLLIVFAPQLDDRGLTALGNAIRPETPGGTAHFTIARPEYASFAETTLLLLAGNAPRGTAAVPSGQPPDTLVRVMRDQAQGVQLLGPPDWRALFDATVTPATAATSSGETVTDTAQALRQSAARLVLVYLAGVTTREVNGGLRVEFARLGDTLDQRDALLLIGGGSGLGAPLAATLSGPAVSVAAPRDLALNDLAPTCAVLLGVAYPAEARGRIAWELLNLDERRKALATAALARQRTTLAARTVPFGAPYPRPLQTALVARLPEVEALLADGQFAYGYQLAASALDEADRALDQPVPTELYVPPPRAAWPLVAGCLALALATIVLALARRAGRALLAAAGGLLLTLLLWLGLVALVRDTVVATLPLVALTLLPPGLAGSRVSLWLNHRRHVSRAALRERFWLTADLLALLVVLPAAYCAYRYGYPWQLRLEEAGPLFQWRAALLAPAVLTLTSYGWIVAPARWRGRRGGKPERRRVEDAVGQP